MTDKLDHGPDCTCGCQDGTDEDMTITLDFGEEGKVEVEPLLFFDLEGKDYIALVPTDEEAEDVLGRLKAIPNVSSVDFDAGSEDYIQENHTLFIVNSSFDYTTVEEQEIEETIKTEFTDHTMVFCNDDIQETKEQS